jgi:DNA-binding response OmpR family regulator
MAFESARTVLLIEGEASLRRLIALGLEQRAIHVVEAGSVRTLPASEGVRVDLLIVDIDKGSRSNSSLLATLRSTPQFAALPMVVLSWEEEPQEGDERTFYLSKPFDARVLYALIEELLIRRQHEESLLAPASASLCPLMTAAGLLLMISGLLVHLLLTGIGLVVTLAALLTWTLGRQPGPALSSAWLQPSYPCHV